MGADDNTEQLLRQAADGQGSAIDLLFARHRDKLQRMVRFRIDRRLSTRIDASDVVQEALLTAARELPDYLQQRPLPFYLWLRRLTWERMLDLHRHHLDAQKRTVTREQLPAFAIGDDSLDLLARGLVWLGPGPLEEAVRREMHQRLEQMLLQLDDQPREVLMLRYLEQLQFGEIAAIMGLTEDTVKLRYLAGIRRLRKLLDQPEHDDE